MLDHPNKTSFKKGHPPWNKGLIGYRKGYRHTEETKKRISETHKRLGLSPSPYKRNPNVEKSCTVCGEKYQVIFSRVDKTKYCSRSCKSKSMLGISSHNKNKFNSKTYNGLHYKVRKIRGTPSLCEVCGTINAKKFEWANLSGHYEDIKDYKRMCASCHAKYDNKGKYLSLTKRKLNQD